MLSKKKLASKDYKLCDSACDIPEKAKLLVGEQIDGYEGWAEGESLLWASKKREDYERTEYRAEETALYPDCNGSCANLHIC